ncbi:MAG: prepilin-type N-terminal cleavage/methylation domain-containing protein [Kiritimatiellia bacterium]
MTVLTGALRHAQKGFTLLEMLLVTVILGLVFSLTYMAFSTVVTAWDRGMELTEHLHHADYVLDQLVMGLRSAYYPDTRGEAAGYGFEIEDGGDGEYSSDTISWVKTGSALVGANSPFAESPHRVQFFMTENEEGEPAAAVRQWRLYGQPEDFDPGELDPVFLSTRITGFNCRVAYRIVADEVEWLDEWQYTNKLPTAVELTLYMAPVQEDGQPVEIKRALGVPVAPLSWN